MEFEELKTLLSERRYRMLRDRLAELNEVDIAEFLGTLPAEQALAVFRMLPKDLCSDVFRELEPEDQQSVINSINDRELHGIIEDIFVDDAVDMLEELPANVVHRVLRAAAPGTRDTLNLFLNYPHDSVGSVMTAEFLDLKAGMTVSEAVAHIRLTGLDKETLYVCYVTDAKRVLTGVLTFKDLLYAGEEDTVGEIMNPDVISVRTSDDKELAASLISKYGFYALPVTDAEHRLVGLVTVDDALDVMREEATEDFHKMAAVLPTEKPYLKTTVFEMYKSRILWLIFLMFSAIISGVILGRYEAIIAAMPVLVSFMPMITGTGGNAGSQSATVIIRGMAIGEIALRDFWKVLGKEVTVGLICGIPLAAFTLVRVLIADHSRPDVLLLATLVSLALLLTVVISKAIGGTLPMIAKKLGADPAIMAAPLITTIVDAVALLMYYSSATRLFLS